MRHIAVMTFTSALGLMGIFLVDLADMYFLSLLGETELASAIGYSGSILFFATSISIGFAITMSALVARAIGADDDVLANQQANSVYMFAVLIAVPISALIWWFVPDLLRLLGAHDRSLELATTFLRIVVPAMTMLMIGMTSSGVMRAQGFANKAMWITLGGAAVNLVLDPILIFGFEMGVAGAAIATACAHITVGVIGFWLVFGSGGFNFAISWQRLRFDLPAINRIAIPAVVTNIATPISTAYITATIAGFGDGAVAGYAIIARVTPVAFGVVYALSGAVGPIIGQNYGASLPARVSQTVREAVWFATGFILLVSLALFLMQDQLIAAFSVTGDAAMMIAFFCTFTAAVFVFDAAQFVSNATFNNLNRASWSTAMNWAKATLGTFPFVWLGAKYFGAPGVLAGQAVGAAISGVVAFGLALWVTRKLQCEVPATLAPTNQKTDPT